MHSSGVANLVQAAHTVEDQFRIRSIDGQVVCTSHQHDKVLRPFIVEDPRKSPADHAGNVLYGG
jgi:hypothetical protein